MRRLVVSICLVAITAFFSFPLQGSFRENEVQTFTLKNGMRFLVVEDHGIPNANMYTFWRVGARNERPGITGLSHFFEHMMFNGSKKFAPGEFDKVMEAAGGANNAYTTSDVTVYTNWFPASAINTVFELEADRIAHLRFDPKVVESERQVVASEKSTGYENTPSQILFEELEGAAFRAHPYQWPVIGFDADIKGWTMQDLKDYHRIYYAPNNAVVVIVGDIKLNQVKSLAQKYFASIPRGPEPPKVRTQEPEQTGERRIEVQRPGVTSPLLGMAWHIPETKHADLLALEMLAQILAKGKVSRLYQSLVEKGKLATTVELWTSKNFDPGLLTLYVEGVPGANRTGIEKNVDDQLALLLKGGVSEEELQMVKNRFQLNFYQTLETINGKAQALGDFAVFYDDYRQLFAYPDRVAKISAADILRVARQYLAPTRRTVGWLVPASKEEGGT